MRSPGHQRRCGADGRRQASPGRGGRYATARRAPTDASPSSM